MGSEPSGSTLPASPFIALPLNLEVGVGTGGSEGVGETLETKFINPDNFIHQPTSFARPRDSSPASHGP